MVMMMVGGVMHAKRHPEDGGSAANVVMEVFLGKTVESLSSHNQLCSIGNYVIGACSVINDSK